MEWTESAVLNVIELYQARPVLWDPKCRGYKDKNKRHDALMEIAEQCNVHKEELERKIKNLQSHFTREVKKVNRSKNSGSGIEEIYRSKWFAFKPLQFLLGRNRSRENQDSDTRHSEQTDEDLTNTIDDEDIFCEDDTTSRKDESLIDDKESPRKRKTQDPLVDVAVTVLRDLYSRNDRDEYTVFGEYVANKIRKLPCRNAKIMVQHLINNTLFEAEIGKYNSLHQSSTSSYAPSHTSPYRSRSPFSPYRSPNSPSQIPAFHILLQQSSDTQSTYSQSHHDEQKFF